MNFTGKGLQHQIPHLSEEHRINAFRKRFYQCVSNVMFKFLERGLPRGGTLFNILIPADFRTRLLKKK